MSYQTLLSPATIGKLELRNRVVLAAMGSNFAEPDGTCGERLQAYYEERARGGAGLLIMETAAVAWPVGATMPNTVGFSEDRFIPALSQLAARVHQHGARIAAQLNHGGKMAQEDVVAGRPVMVPSIPKPGGSDMFKLLTAQEIGSFVKAGGPDGKGARFHEMTQQDISEMVAQFAAAACRAQQARFDAIEVHAGHGYILSSFLSPAVNKRSDGYGGSPQNRARFLCEVIAAIRAAVGAYFPILVRLDAKEYRIEGGIEPEDCLITAQLAAAAGADALDVSAYGNTGKGIAFTEAPLVHQPAGFVPFARAVKAVVDIPVIAVGRIEVDVAEKGLRAGDFDFVAMGRKLLADPFLPAKLSAGKPETIRPCIYCYVCVSKIFINEAMSCAVNPACGRESQLNVIHSSVDQKQRALVIGGGPGGLESARVLALQGFAVTLWEKEKDLGGTARIAAVVYEPNQRLVDHLASEVQALSVEVQTGKTAQMADIQSLQPDVVVVATGANRAAPDIIGKNQRHVFDGNELRGLLFGTDANAAKKLGPLQRTMVKLGVISQLLRGITALRWLSKIWMPLSRHITIIGGDLVGLELAEYLVARGRKVTVLEPSPDLGAQLSILRRARLVHELRAHGVALHRNAPIEEITADAVMYTLKGEQQQTPPGQVIIAIGAEPDTRLADGIAAAGFEVHCVGDCAQIGYIEGAILSGRRTALTIAGVTT